ncbi:MAG: hypothetical protein ACJ73N_15865 [Bryobacteraceae bacterium]
MKRKPAKKVAAKAQRARQAVVRSPRHSHVRLVAAGSKESHLDEDSAPDAPILEQAAAALPAVESPSMAAQDNSQRWMSENESAKAFDQFPAAPHAAFRLFPAAPQAPAYPTKLPEIAQANMKLAFEFAQRFAQIKSPFEIPSVLSELMFKQFTILQKIAFPNQSTR